MILRRLNSLWVVPQLRIGVANSLVRQRHLVEIGRSISSDMSEFRQVFSKAKHIAIITGAGVSAESGVSTFRGVGGSWRMWKAQDLATPEAFSRNPSRVWEFYHYRRELALSKAPNAAHRAIAECEARLSRQGRYITVITQNGDELHQRAGSKHVLEIHGNLFKTRCVSCGDVASSHQSPICPALAETGDPDPHTLDSQVLTKVEEELNICDLCLVVGTSSIVYPAAMFGPQVASRGVPVAEFNTTATPFTNRFTFHFQGPCGTTLPPALARHETEVI
ncbi:hypothetical protein COCON_G00135800 [Conger conger]|uniref:NAD-dependent protein deacylase sirtuin-5, mitochondrial n=1 Tax=Conger conger TaxID=82655 RepID=A0A9Q1DEQ1_CONCO|nr:hypothetical protein COCON_G00135800 [Conger conger]